MSSLPSGTVTFLFTDIQGSTRLWQSDPDLMKEALTRHDALLRQAIESHGGFVFKTVGDAFCAAFDTAMDGVKAAVDGQLAITRERWDLPRPIRVRMALHTGEAVERDRDYYGPALNRTARLEAIGYGGQALVSLVTAELVRDMLPAPLGLVAMGEQRLKDLTRPEVVCQLTHPDLPAVFPALKSLDSHPHNLPLQPTALVGRERELATLEELLVDPAVRLVTLTGPGGMGKTRLALQAAADLIERFRDGAFFVDLAPVNDPSLVPATVARALHVRESAGRSLAEAVIEHLRGSATLLVLDNFEQVLDAAVGVAGMLAACPGVSVLATSREPLRVRGERVFAVPPLALPPVPRPGAPARPADAQALGAFESVRLFIERATAVRRDFQVTSENAPAVAEICVRLDGIPLAIELAAARSRLLSPQEILARLDRSLRLLVGGARDLPDRQRTLRAAIDWSHDMLDGQARDVFRALAVFAGGFTYEAAAAVAVDGACREDELLDVLGALVDKSLVAVEQGDAEAGSGEARFRLLETVREYALEKLRASGQEQQVRRRHALHFLGLAAEFDARADSAGQGARLRLLEREAENMRAALGCLGEQEDRSDFIVLATCLWRYWRMRGPYGEGRAWIALASRLAGADPARAAELARREGVLARLQGSYGEAMELFQRSVQLSAGAGDERAQRRARVDVGVTLVFTGELDRARQLLEACRGGPSGGDALDLEDRELAAHAGLQLGNVALRQGALERAGSLFEEARAFFNSRAMPREQALAAGSLALIHHGRGDLAQAESLLRQAIALNEQVGDQETLCTLRNNLATLQLDAGRHEEALGQFEPLLACAQRLGNLRFQCAARAGLAEACLALGRLERAGEAAAAALEDAERLADGPTTAYCCRVMGQVHAAGGRPAEARRLLGRCLEMLEGTAEQEEMEKARKTLAVLPG